MGLFLTFITFVFIATLMRGIEQMQTKKTTIKPKVRPTVEPQKSKIVLKEKSTTDRGKREKSPIPRRDRVKKKRHQTKPTKEMLLNGIVMAEILSPPKCKRK